MKATAAKVEDTHIPDVGKVVDDGFLVSLEQLSMLGDGDVKRGRKRLRLLIAAERERKPMGVTAPVACPKNIRIATTNDERAIFDLLMADLAENAAHIAPVDEEIVLSSILIGTRGEGGVKGVIGLIDGPDGLPIATVGLVPQRWWWSRAYHWVEVWAFVHPDHRRSDHADTLIQFSKWVGDHWTKSFGYRVYVLMGVLGSKRTREKIRLYSRKLTQIGASFLHPTPPMEF